MAQQQQSNYVALGPDRVQEWSTNAVWVPPAPPPVVTQRGGVVAPATVLIADAALPAGDPGESPLTTNAGQTIPTELDTRAIVLAAAPTVVANTATNPFRASDEIVLRGAPLVVPPVDAGSGGS